jgi:hypothetical protein
MTYLVALSFCEEDSEYARSLAKCFSLARVSCYFYKGARRVDRLMYELHASIYLSARARVYFLRASSFERRYTRFEINCGRNRANNFLISDAGLLERDVPEEFMFIHEKGWTVVASPGDHVPYRDVAGYVLKALRQ